MKRSLIVPAKLTALIFLTPIAHAQLGSGSAANQLCSASGQGRGCLHDISLGSTRSPASAYSYLGTEANFMQSFLQSMTMGLMNTNNQRITQQKIDFELDKRKKRKLKLIAWLADDARDPVLMETGAGQPPDPKAVKLNALIAGIKKKIGHVRYPNHFMEKQREIQDCVDSGKCKLIGSPQSAKRLAYVQDGETCDIAAQGEILRDANRPFKLQFTDGHNERIDPAQTSPQKLENKMFQYAQDKEYYLGTREDGATPAYASGHILSDIGFKVIKEDHPLGGVPDINDVPKALQQGHYVVTWLSTTHLWRSSKVGGNHAVLVTGAVVQNDDVKGVYINDTGTGNNNERAAFLIPVEYFQNAWRNDHGHKIEVIPPSH